MKKSFFVVFLVLFGVLFSATSCKEESVFKVPPSSDIDFTDTIFDGEETTNCALEPISCSNDSDCAVCGNGWQCCSGYCMQECPDGDEDKSVDAEYQCPALGLECSTWMDCYLFCPTDERPYACRGGVCAYADEPVDGDAEEGIELEDSETEQLEMFEEFESVPEQELTEIVDIYESETDTLDNYCYPTGENRAPVISTSFEPQQIFVGDLMMLDLKARDNDPCDTLTCECVQCPAGLQISLIDGSPGNDYVWRITWQPTDADVGHHEFTFKITDSAPEPKYSTTVLVVDVLEVPINHPPRFEDIPDRELLVGDKLNFAFRVWDEDGDTISFQVLNSPPEITMEYDTNSSVVNVIADASAMSQPGLLRATFELSDEQGANTQGEVKVNVFPRARANDCNGAIKLYMHDRYFGNTEDRSNASNVSAPCIEFTQQGGDMFFRLKRDPGQHLRVHVNPLDDGFDVAVHVWNRDCQRCIAGDDIFVDGMAENLLIGAIQPEYPELTIVVDSYSSNHRGPFMITVVPEDVNVGNAPLCGSCESNLDCGYFANCVEVVYDSVVVERACGKNCNGNDDCPQGYACKQLSLVNGGVAAQCYPDYYRTGRTGYDVLTCAAFNELGQQCEDTNTMQDEAECGADDAGIIIDDADCITVDIDDQERSLCSVKCSDDNSCPEDYECVWQGWYGYCLPSD